MLLAPSVSYKEIFYKAREHYWILNVTASGFWIPGQYNLNFYYHIIYPPTVDFSEDFFFMILTYFHTLILPWGKYLMQLERVNSHWCNFHCIFKVNSPVTLKMDQGYQNQSECIISSTMLHSVFYSVFSVCFCFLTMQFHKFCSTESEKMATFVKGGNKSIISLKYTLFI